MTDLPPLHARLHEATPEAIADALRYLGTADAVAALLAAAEGGVDWRWQYRFVTMMRAMDQGMDRPTAERYADNDVAALEGFAAMRDSGEGRG